MEENSTTGFFPNRFRHNRKQPVQPPWPSLAIDISGNEVLKNPLPHFSNSSNPQFIRDRY
jgi:hypothetical protein